MAACDALQVKGVMAIQPYIQLLNVSYRYPRGEWVLRDLNLKLYQNQFTAITGPNGSGKTTLGKLISGIFKPVKGQVLINGRDSREMSLGEVGKRIGYLFQNPNHQIFAPSVVEEISLALKFRGLSEKEIHDIVADALEAFHLSHLKDAFPLRLSRGERQRLAIASILVNDPGFLIMDEPTTGLDLKRKKTLSGMLEDLGKKGIGMVVISHDNNFVRHHADRIIVISGGEIIDDRSC